MRGLVLNKGNKSRGFKGFCPEVYRKAPKFKITGEKFFWPQDLKNHRAK